MLQTSNNFWFLQENSAATIPTPGLCQVVDFNGNNVVTYLPDNVVAVCESAPTPPGSSNVVDFNGDQIIDFNNNDVIAAY